MKKQGFLKRLKLTLAVASKYAQQHLASILAMDAIYTRQWLDEHENKEYTKILKILPEGSIYRIVEKLCLDKLVIKEETWIATYGWHSNGHLIEIGGFRYCIFDALRQTIYIESYDDADYKTVDVYHQI